MALVERQLKAREAADGHLRQVCPVRPAGTSSCWRMGADPFAVRHGRAALGRPRPTIDGRRTILAGTNNYLGLTYDPACIAAAEAALRHYGTGTTGSRIANGTYGAATRSWRRRSRGLHASASCMVFSTGYQANLAMIAGLAGPARRGADRCRFARQHLRRLQAVGRHHRPLPPQRRRRPRQAPGPPRRRRATASW